MSANLPVPLRLPSALAYATWHERSHADAAHVWFRRLLHRAA